MKGSAGRPDSSSFDTDAIIAAGHRERSSVVRRRQRRALSVSFGVLAIWLAAVVVLGHWSRVVDNWAAALTMVFGSFVAGSTPQGGGAVAFPVFTKVLDVDTSVARSFSLCIQTVGMGAAALAIVINRRAVAWRAVGVGAPFAIAAFVVTTTMLADGDAPFWPSRVPGQYVKVTFTILVAAMAVIVWLGYRVQLLERIEQLDVSRRRVAGLVAVAAALGGVASALTGSGADVLVYLAVVVIIGVTPRIGVPTSVVMMAIVSVVGFVLHGIVDGQLDVQLATLASGREVVAAIGGEPVGLVDGTAVFLPADPAASTTIGLDPQRFDLFGLWLAAVPVVAFGAPLGSWVSSLATDRQLVRFVVALALAETLSTIIFLDGLARNPDGALIAYGVIGLVVVMGGLWALKTYRRQLLGLPPVDLDASFTRERLDTGPDFRRQLGRRNGKADASSDQDASGDQDPGGDQDASGDQDPGGDQDASGDQEGT